MTYKNIILGFCVVIVAGLAAWTTLLSYNTPQAAANNITEDLPDAFMEDVTAVIMDKQGKPQMKIITPKLAHYPEKDTTQFISPQLTLYRKSPKPWFITSKFAKATEGVENINFWDNVTVHHAADENNPATLIKTSTLTVYPNKKLAETDHLITMIQPSLIVKAIGMHADMNTGDIKLLSHARGEYVPN